ncbi:MAG: tRNA threonylcarbamoyladenosine dehydratase [Akkermansiaceae bacterium]
MTDDFLHRFGGIGRLYGIATLEAFSNSHVMIVGLGGVGSWAVEALARSGIGHLSLVDLDDLCQTNINRQIHALTNTVGQSKATALATRLREINPAIGITIHQCFYSEKNADELLLRNQPDAVIDAIDSVRPKCHLLATCRQHEIPVIASGAAGGRFDATQIRLDDLSKTHGDSLLQVVRRILRSDYRFPAAAKKSSKFRIPAIFSPEQPKFPQCDGTTSTNRPTKIHGKIKCDSGYGAATHLTATFGNLASGWILTVLAEKNQKSDNS